MDFLARLDEESSRYKRGLELQDRRDLSQLRREVCAPYVGYRVTRQPTTTWSNGSALGQWKYSNGLLARTKQGQWYTREGKYVEDPDKARFEACEYLGRQLCPLGKADDDLLAVTVMGLINKAAPPKEEPKTEEPKEASDKSE